ncbi:DUF5682 family protein [Neobacillus mesonae]|nr:DUF5682 family protein [Neobacillus mesonae]
MIREAGADSPWNLLEGELLLSGDQTKLNEIFRRKVLNYDNDIIYFPIRHHSPACSFQLKRVIDKYKPEILLIEGPESGNPLIKVLTDEGTSPPVCLYYTYENEVERSACYYPLLDYSPEYVAIQEAAKRGIKASFIDRNYRERAAGREEASYQDESLLAGSEFVRSLCLRTNSRSFDELWEKWFEVGGISQSPEDFVEGVFTYCTLSRMCYSEERLLSEGDLSRESFMRERIAEASARYSRVMVITGGFHTYGLLQDEPDRTDETAAYHDLKEQIYPMIYSFAEADRLNGYASGMPYVNYYQEAWLRLEQGSDSPFTIASLNFLSQLVRKLRREQESASTSDAIEAYSMIQGLASLRRKREGGVYELLDGVLSSFVKGEQNLARNKPIEALEGLLTGEMMGVLAANEFSVPIVEDFKAQCASLRIQTSSTGKRKKALELYSKRKHRQISQFMHSVHFLDTGFAVRESGPDWTKYTDMNLVRETWTYGYSAGVEAKLIESSLYGGSIKEAAIRKAEEGLLELPEHHSEAAADWLLKVLLMGLEHLAEPICTKVEQALRQDGSFLSLCGTLHKLYRIHTHRNMLGLTRNLQLPALMAEAYDNAVTILHHLSKPRVEEHSEIIQGLKLLAMLGDNMKDQVQPSAFQNALYSLLASTDLAPRIEGVVIAMLVSQGKYGRAEIVDRAKSYIHGTPDKVRQTAEYLQGVFEAARDIFLMDNDLIQELNFLLEEMSYEEFMQMIPELRLAFTYFTKEEIEMIAKRVAGLHQVHDHKLELPAIEESTIQKASLLDEAIRKEFAKWML